MAKQPHTFLLPQQVVTIPDYLVDLHQHWSPNDDVDPSNVSSSPSAFKINMGIMDIASLLAHHLYFQAKRLVEETTEDILNEIIQDLRNEEEAN